jgi:hypothetical protein
MYMPEKYYVLVTDAKRAFCKAVSTGRERSTWGGLHYKSKGFKPEINHAPYLVGKTGLVHPAVIEFYRTFDKNKADELKKASAARNFGGMPFEIIVLCAAIPEVLQEGRMPVLMYDVPKNDYFISSLFSNEFVKVEASGRSAIEQKVEELCRKFEIPVTKGFGGGDLLKEWRDSLDWQIRYLEAFDSLMADRIEQIRLSHLPTNLTEDSYEAKRAIGLAQMVNL